jgi:hypothetical protein
MNTEICSRSTLGGYTMQRVLVMEGIEQMGRRLASGRERQGGGEITRGKAARLHLKADGRIFYRHLAAALR